MTAPQPDFIDDDMIDAVLGDLDDGRLCAPDRCRTDEGCICAVAAAVIRKLRKERGA